MATAVKHSYDEETQSSDSTNDVHGSPPIKLSVHHQINCPWCSESFDAPEDGVKPDHDTLKEHIALVHPRIANLSAHDVARKDNDSDDTMTVRNVAAVTAPVTEVDLTPIGSETPDIDLNAGAADSLDSKLHDLERQQERARNTEKSLMACWKLHDARKFSPDYDDTTAELEETWGYVFDDSKANKKAKGRKRNRPNPYLSTTTKKGEFLEVTPVEEFLISLNDYESMSTDQLYAASQNVYHALKTWQDEWMAIEELNKRLSTKTKKSANPRTLDPPKVFQDKREAALYGYKYDHSIHDPKKNDVNSETTFKSQDPFIQGGFRPTPAQLRKMQSEVGKNKPNPDGFKTMTRHGQEYIPRFQDPPLVPFESRGSTTRKRKLPQGEVAALRQASVHDSTPAYDSDLDGQPLKRVTRSAVSKTVEKPQTKTAPPSPGPRARGGKKRGGASKASQLSKITSEQVITQTGDTPTDSTLSTGIETTASSAPIVTQAPFIGFVSAPSPEQADIASAPKPALAPAAPGAPPALAALPSNLMEPGEEVTEEELRRREKIAKSKNPRRTIAMLDHWSKFHGDGRVRNPKRTREQMEADRLAEEQRKASEQGKPAKRRRRRAANTTTVSDATVTPMITTTATVAGVSLQPVSIQPAAMTTTIAPVVSSSPPLPPPAARSQGFPIPPSEPHQPQPSRIFSSLHPDPITGRIPQPPLNPNPTLPGLPEVNRNTAPPPLWTAPSQFYTYGNPPPPLPYHPFGQPQYPHPHPPPLPLQLHQASRPAADPTEHMQPGANYPYAFRPFHPPQNGPQTRRP
ncbi:conserved hypothetical protein [Talaromyces stipitatus ATCC 10500]|uniref:Uncharacterized protein n=1 Tax=Talaromyces stipitatus (strain ATCC 10500 / CBS 375.48 / QM 6759 / NRRL 1006) TaxID=441959 RepID=B8MFF2_TALSN|nr:uncharacterized protein TSTA_017600 [Talaromyces stipitatus ATCC 10500]EED16686.1 conserved hypothetical protein [Talaromyces stipitatus ATCC 10500]